MTPDQVVEIIRRMACLTCYARRGDPPHHVKTRGSGGKDERNVVPLCWKCHSEVHTIGTKTFADKYAIDLRWEAEVLWNQLIDLEVDDPYVETLVGVEWWN